MLLSEREDVVSEVVVSARLPARPSHRSSRIAPKGMVGPHVDRPVRIHVIVRQIQGGGAGVGAVAILHPSILKVRLQLRDVVLGLRGLLVGFARVNGPVIQEHVVIRRNLRPLNGHRADGGGNVQRVDPANGGVAVGPVVAVTLIARGRVHAAGVSAGLDRVVVGPGAEGAVAVVRARYIGDLRLRFRHKGEVGGDAIRPALVWHRLGAQRNRPLVVVSGSGRLH